MKITQKKYCTLLLLVGLVLASCNSNEKVKEKPDQHEEPANVVELTEAQFRTASIDYDHVEMRTISGIIQASGKLDVPPQSKVSISAPMGGFVKETEMLQGSHVNKGEVIVVMQHPDYIQLQQEYKEAYSQIDYLKEEFERQQELSNENVNAKKTLQKAKADYQTAQAKMEGLKAKLQMLNINVSALEKGQIQNTINLYSPIDGYVTKVNVNIGSYVNPNDVMFEIVNTEHLHAELTIFEKDVPRLKIGQRVLFTLANEIKPRSASVHLVGKEINPDRSIQIHCHLDKEDKELIPGMYLKAIVETDSAHVTALPNQSIVSFEGKKYIFIESKEQEHSNTGKDAAHHFQMIEVGTGESELGYSEVILPKDFDPNSKVVFTGAYSLLSKLKNSEEDEGHAH
jgi:membrane fusion protein, heavy metal efflux system